MAEAYNPINTFRKHGIEDGRMLGRLRDAWA
jgi:hypothetical protein